MFSKFSAKSLLNISKQLQLYYNTKAVRLIQTSFLQNQNDVFSKSRLQSRFQTERKISQVNRQSVFRASETKHENLHNELNELMAAFPDVLKDISDWSEQYASKELVERIVRAFEYNVPYGKQLRALGVIMLYKSLTDPTQHTPENLKRVRYLAWIMEILPASVLMSDDIIDGGETRRGRPCWYKLENIKLSALNDIVIVENSVYYLLQKHFSHLPCYNQLMEHLHKAVLLTMFGQSMDILVKEDGVQNFTEERYKKFVQLKSCYFSYYAPFGLVTSFIGIKSTELFEKVKPIFDQMGEYYQVQNDFYDCFGDPEVLKKQGRDIEDGQCTWLAVKCMELANEEQKKIMIECYGKNDSGLAERVKQVYKELNLEEQFYRYEEDTYNSVAELIQKLSCDIPHETFLNPLNMLFNRV